MRTRKKGQALFRSIGAVYKSLNMDSQSLQKTFVASTGAGSDPVGESELEESSS